MVCDFCKSKIAEASWLEPNSTATFAVVAELGYLSQHAASTAAHQNQDRSPRRDRRALAVREVRAPQP